MLEIRNDFYFINTRLYGRYFLTKLFLSVGNICVAFHLLKKVLWTYVGNDIVFGLERGDL
jgi:hypothetical protein